MEELKINCSLDKEDSIVLKNAITKDILSISLDTGGGCGSVYVDFKNAVKIKNYIDEAIKEYEIKKEERMASLYPQEWKGSNLETLNISGWRSLLGPEFYICLNGNEFTADLNTLDEVIKKLTDIKNYYEYYEE